MSVCESIEYRVSEIGASVGKILGQVTRFIRESVIGVLEGVTIGGFLEFGVLGVMSLGNLSGLPPGVFTAVFAVLAAARRVILNFNQI